MTIQKAVFFGIASVAITSTATAQYCAPAHTVYAHPSYHRVHHLSYGYPQLSYSSVHYPQTLEITPSPEDISFGEFSHVNELVVRLEVLMNQICLDL